MMPAGSSDLLVDRDGDAGRARQGVHAGPPGLATFAHGTVVAGALLLATADGVSQLYVAAFVIAVGMAWNVPLLILIAVDSATDAERSRASPR